jgi:hypothetical protein
MTHPPIFSNYPNFIFIYVARFDSKTPFKPTRIANSAVPNAGIYSSNSLNYQMDMQHN